MRRAWVFPTALLLLAACDGLPSWLGGASEEKPKVPGERIGILPADETLKPDEALGSLPVRLPAPQANAEWPQTSGIFGNLAAGGLKESRRAVVGQGAGYGHALAPRPVAAMGLVFAMDGQGHISAHEAADITRLRWKSTGVSEEDEPDVMGGGLAYAQERLYATSGRGQVAAFDAHTGKALWRREVGIPFRSAPGLSGGKLFAVTIDSQLFALDAATGKTLWTHRGMGETAGLMNAVSPAIAGGWVIAPYVSGDIYALSFDTGQELWSDSLAAPRRDLATSVFTGIGGDPVADGDALFAVSQGGMLCAVSLSQGRRFWERPVSSINTPWLAGDYLYVLTADNTLAAFLKYDGRVRWAKKFPSYGEEETKRFPVVWRGPVMAQGKLVLVSSKGKLVLVDAADGVVAATLDVPEGIYTAPILVDGRMYVVSGDAMLYQLQ